MTPVRLALLALVLAVLAIGLGLAAAVLDTAFTAH
jgi:hypothetical protein